MRSNQTFILFAYGEMEKKEKKSVRTDEELAKKLDEIFDKNSSVLTLPSGREINDNEWMHEDADLLLVEFLKQLGYEKTVEKYYEMKKYFRYA